MWCVVECGGGGEDGCVLVVFCVVVDVGGGGCGGFVGFVGFDVVVG